MPVYQVTIQDTDGVVSTKPIERFFTMDMKLSKFLHDKNLDLDWFKKRISAYYRCTGEVIVKQVDAQGLDLEFFR